MCSFNTFLHKTLLSSPHVQKDIQYVTVQMEFSFTNTASGLILSKSLCKLVPAGLAYGQEH